MLDQSAQRSETEVPRARLKFELATRLEGILELRDLAKSALEESRFNKAKFSDEKFVKAAKIAAREPKVHGVLTAHLADRPVGFAYCQVGEPLVGTGLTISTVQVLYVEERVRASILGGRIANGLLNGVLSWSSSRNTSEVFIHTTSGIKTITNDQFLKRRGFKVLGGSYAREI